MNLFLQENIEFRCPGSCQTTFLRTYIYVLKNVIWREPEQGHIYIYIFPRTKHLFQANDIVAPRVHSI